MPTLKFKRFNKPHVLKQIGRGLLAQFFAKFADDFQSKGLVLPGPDLPDMDYFDALARLLMCPEGLPDRLNEAQGLTEVFGRVLAPRTDQGKVLRCRSSAGGDSF